MRQPTLRVTEPAAPRLGAVLVAIGGMGAAWTLDALARNRRAARIHRVTVDLLLNTLQADDAITGRHSRRVANLAEALAAPLRLAARERSTLRVAALLHDMGKIDDRFFHIVHSRERLSPEQRAEIEHHPHESAHILRPLEPIHPGLMDIVASHHECWDGSGYPRGAVGEGIPLGARIIALADVFDAVTQPRSYHEPQDAKLAFEELERGAGTRFDPRLVRLLLGSPGVRRRWHAIAEQGHAEEAAAGNVEDELTP
jgi:putative nucleotidyltransferase with HDIG domain